MYTSIIELVKKTVNLNSNHPAFSIKTGFRTRTYSYEEVFGIIKKFQQFFDKNDIKKDDKIIIFSLNRPEYSMLILGALLNGVILVPIDYRTNEETISKFIEKTKPKAVFTLEIFSSLFKSFEVEKFYFEQLAEILNNYKTSEEFPARHEDELAAILFTSGTTGEPKGTLVTVGNILASVNNINQVFTLPEHFRILSVLPLSHALEMFGGLLVTFSLGCHIHYLERINSITIIHALRRYHIQGMAVVPQMLRLMLSNIERKIKDDKKEKEWKIAQSIAQFTPTSMRRVIFSKFHQNIGGSFSLFVCGSAPLEKKLSQIWGNTGVTVLEGYGASETTGFISTNTLNNHKTGTVGKILPGISHRLNHDMGLEVKGDNVVSGYLDNPEKTKESFNNGWFLTGDIVNIDKDGYLKIVGRDKFKIVLSDGKKVYPEDIENKLNNFEEVIDSTVFGIKKEEGEIVHAELILKPHSSAAKIIEKVNEQLNAHEQIMDYGIWQHGDFPRTKTLKVDRDAVRNEIAIKSKAKSIQKNHEEDSDKLNQVLKLVSGKKGDIEESFKLTTDLKMDSLKRIELLAFIEEEMGVSVEEMKINSKTTVAGLRELIKNGKPVVIEDGEKIDYKQLSDPMCNLRVNLQELLMFPAFSLGFKIKIRNAENINKIKTPQLFIFNHVGMYDVVNILRILPRQIRSKTAIAATSQIWHDPLYTKLFATVFANAFPFVKAESHNAMRGNFERIGELLDKGFNIMISPEGNITHTGELLPFHTGAGYIAVEMGVPVTPFKIMGYYDLWPENRRRKVNIFWPKKFGTVEVIIGEPIVFDKNVSYEDATKVLRDEMIKLK